MFYFYVMETLYLLYMAILVGSVSETVLCGTVVRFIERFSVVFLLNTDTVCNRNASV